jgi:hypothetical protein
MTVPRDRDRWFTSSWSKDNADCVEVALGAAVGIRDTKDRAGGELDVRATAWSALVASVKTQS